jgi:hypothetical protein
VAVAWVKARLPVRSALFKQDTGGLVVRWVTTSESPLLYVFVSCWMGEEMKEKVVVLRELQRAIMYTNELSKQAMEGHVSRAFTVYSVHDDARLTSPFLRM